MPDILVIEDDSELYALLNAYLADEGFRCENAPDGRKGLEALARSAYDAVVLDVMLPEVNGFDVLRQIRANPALTLLPVLMLTARGDEVDRVVGLEMGADDYLGKPFSPRELVARLRALLRRAQGQQGAAGADQVQVGDIIIKPSALCVLVGNESVSLSFPEMRLLTLLTENLGRITGRDALYKAIFGHQAYPMDRSLDMLVSRLRKKIGPFPGGEPRIKAVRGEGYIYLEAER